MQIFPLTVAVYAFSGVRDVSRAVSRDDAVGAVLGCLELVLGALAIVALLNR